MAGEDEGGWDRILLIFSKDGLRLCGFFFLNSKAQLNFLFKRAAVNVSAGGGGGDCFRKAVKKEED